MSKPKSFTERIKKIPLRPFPSDVVIVVSPNAQTSRIKRNHLFGLYDRDGFTEALVCGNPQNGDFWMFLSERCSLDTIIHETYHVVSRTMKFVGAEPEEEVMAYFIGYIGQEVAAFVYKMKRGKERKSVRRKKAPAPTLEPAQPASSSAPATKRF